MTCTCCPCGPARRSWTQGSGRTQRKMSAWPNYCMCFRQLGGKRKKLRNVYIQYECNKYQELNSVNLMSWFFFLCFSSRKLLKLIKFYRFQYSNYVNLMYCLFSICFSSRKIVDILTNTNNLVYSILFMFFILFHMINNFVNLLFFN